MQLCIMLKSNIVGIRFTPRAMSVLKCEAARAKRSVSDLIRIVLEERFKTMATPRVKK